MLDLKTAAQEWRGHELATSKVLLALLLKAQSGGNDFSRAERLLFTACEFWAAAKNRTLSEYLPTNGAIGKLFDAEESFEAIGLTDLAYLLLVARIMLGCKERPLPLDALVTTIEDAVAQSGEPVDELIAQFAGERTWDGVPPR